MKLNKENKRGISLIVLVITIIVMIILAAAIILSLNSSGIIGKANKAKLDNDLASLKDAAVAVLAEYELNAKLSNTYSNEGALQHVKNDLKDSFTAEELDKIIINTNNSIGVIGIDEYYYIDNTITDGTNNKVVIPSGFIVSDIPGEDTIKGGLVIYEGSDKVSTDEDAKTTRNQFVWVPVDNYALFERTTTYNGTITPPPSTSLEPATEVSTATLNAPHVVLSLTNDLTGEHAEYAAMRASVQKYKGFYIGRYEAGTTEKRGYNSGKGSPTMPVYVQADKPVYDRVAWGASMVNVEDDYINSSGVNYGKGAVYLARNLYPNNNSIVSTLTYGVEWDAAMQFICKTDPTFANNKTTNGWYYEVSNIRKQWYPNYKTGVDLGEYAANSVNNIYDMAGFIGEWSMESYTNLENENNRKFCFRRGIRGRTYDVTLKDYYPYQRDLWNYNTITEAIGFRVSLYLK